MSCRPRAGLAGGDFARAGLIALALAGSACSPPDGNGAPATADDPGARTAAHRPGNLASAQAAEVAEVAAPRAIVSLSPLATRFLFALGVGAQVVAVDRESASLPGLASLPVTDRAGAERFEPDFILTSEFATDSPAATNAPAGAARGEVAIGPRVLEFAPHDLEDVYALCREIGTALAGEAEATALERRIARPLARVAGESPPDGRPGIVALIGLDPLEIAGGHSFETDLIEAAGGSSLTHGSDETRRTVDRETLRRLRPDLIVAVSTEELPADAQERVVVAVGDLAPVVFFVFDRERFWLEEPARDALRLRELIASFREPLGPDDADRSDLSTAVPIPAPPRAGPTW